MFYFGPVPCYFTVSLQSVIVPLYSPQKITSWRGVEEEGVVKSTQCLSGVPWLYTGQNERGLIHGVSVFTLTHRFCTCGLFVCVNCGWGRDLCVCVWEWVSVFYVCVIVCWKFLHLMHSRINRWDFGGQRWNDGAVICHQSLFTAADFDHFSQGAVSLTAILGVHLCCKGEYARSRPSKFHCVLTGCTRGHLGICRSQNFTLTYVFKRTCSSWLWVNSLKISSSAFGAAVFRKCVRKHSAPQTHRLWCHQANSLLWVATTPLGILSTVCFSSLMCQWNGSTNTTRPKVGHCLWI